MKISEMQISEFNNSFYRSWVYHRDGFLCAETVELNDSISAYCAGGPL